MEGFGSRRPRTSSHDTLRSVSMPDATRLRHVEINVLSQDISSLPETFFNASPWHPWHTDGDASAVHPAKRRKVTRPWEQAADPSHASSNITLARLDLKIRSLNASSSSITQPSPPASPNGACTPPVSEAVPVRIKSFEEIDDSRYEMVVLHGDTSYSFSLPICLEAQDSAMMQTLIAIQSTSMKGSASASATLQRIHQELQESLYNLDCRICWRDATSLETSALKGIDRTVWQHFTTTPSPRPAWSPREFYDSVYTPPKSSGHPPLRVPGLESQLYPFQERSVQWLLKREGASNPHLTNGNTSAIDDDLRLGFETSSDADGRQVFLHPRLGLATTSKALTRIRTQGLRGGILAEEMGLGKTVEVISLILMHERPDVEHGLLDDSSGLRQSRATIIVAPEAIQQQWESEIHMHAPKLKVMTYKGVKMATKRLSEEDLILELLDQDVVLVTYTALSSDFYFSGAAPQRTTRHERRYVAKRSPLVRIHWWRCILDECQMVESGVNQAAQVAAKIPRHCAWAVSGTPIKKNDMDLLGLLAFLRLEPLYNSPGLWKHLLAGDRSWFKTLFGTIALRHTKEQVKHDIQLPPQKRIVLTASFSQIEEQYYSNLFHEMCNDCRLHLDGSPRSGDWDPNSSTTIETMRSWLSRLRQACLHPGVGDRNRRALGGGEGPLRTIGEVLRVMLEQNETAIRTEERSYLITRLKRGQLFEHARQPLEAKMIWQAVLEQASAAVQACRLEYNEARVGAALDPGLDADDVANAETRLSALRLRLRSALEVEHMAAFFIGNAYFQIKTDEQMTERDSSAYKDLEVAETRMYDRAKGMRTEMLTESRTRADVSVQAIPVTTSWTAVTKFRTLEFSGGIQSIDILDAAEELVDALNIQAETLHEWRSELVRLLNLPLIDQEDDDLQGDEYEKSTKEQDKIYVYMEGVRALIADRRDALYGPENTLIKHEMAMALQQALRGEGHDPTVMVEVLRKRLEVKPRAGLGTVQALSLRLRQLMQDLAPSGGGGGGSGRLAAEHAMVQSAYSRIRHDLTAQGKILIEVEREGSTFRAAMNARLEYYRQLQLISDMVAPLEEELTDARRLELDRSDEKARQKLATLRSRARYLEHLQHDASNETAERRCIICQEHFEQGLLTSCGHSFCKECLNIWRREHGTCPSCKKHLRSRDLHQISYKPQQILMQEETTTKDVHATGSRTNDLTNGSTSIYSGISSTTLAQIQDMDVKGSFGTKIDTLARHLLWLRSHDRGAKSIIFSQFRDFLDVLARAFSKFGIHWTDIDKRRGIEEFKHDPNIECFFLHAKAHASGLNLVNATHVFLCEPLINTALELQAIARVHRIGQHRPTTVWMYLIDGTVEKAIYDISVQRRLEHLQRTSVEDATSVSGKSKQKQINGHDTNGTSQLNGYKSHPTQSKTPNTSIDEDIEKANSRELQEASTSKLLTGGRVGGELVRSDDLWRCLFSNVGAARIQNDVVGLANGLGDELDSLNGYDNGGLNGESTVGAAQRVATGHVAADAAERRAIASSDA